MKERASTLVFQPHYHYTINSCGALCTYSLYDKQVNGAGREEDKKTRSVLLVSQLVASKGCPLSAGCWSSLLRGSRIQQPNLKKGKKRPCLGWSYEAYLHIMKRPSRAYLVLVLRVGVCKNVEPTGSGTSSDNGKGGELDTAEPEEIAQDECLVTEGDLFCDKQMTPNKNLRAANPKKRALSESGSKASYSTDSDYSTLDASDASSAAQYVLLFGESVPYLARTLSD
ncbi:hypothetical protein VNO77_46798 [Canavalia gladiata]|uniref:Uncharacterized protein n=1 Tax=Canavalia gladiata TaxID=3824 RepID=A0AAN9JHU3_CANGL